MLKWLRGATTAAGVRIRGPPSLIDCDESEPRNSVVFMASCDAPYNRREIVMMSAGRNLDAKSAPGGKKVRVSARSLTSIAPQAPAAKTISSAGAQTARRWQGQTDPAGGDARAAK